MELQDYAMPIIKGVKLYTLYSLLKTEKEALAVDRIENTFIRERLETIRKIKTKQ